MSNKINDACIEAAGEAGLIAGSASVVAHKARTARAGAAPRPRGGRTSTAEWPAPAGEASPE